jgi:hypothetical protein
MLCLPETIPSATVRVMSASVGLTGMSSLGPHLGPSFALYQHLCSCYPSDHLGVSMSRIGTAAATPLHLSALASEVVALQHVEIFSKPIIFTSWQSQSHNRVLN